jgi:hypothetical protein
MKSGKVWTEKANLCDSRTPLIASSKLKRRCRVELSKKLNHDDGFKVLEAVVYVYINTAWVPLSHRSHRYTSIKDIWQTILLESRTESYHHLKSTHYPLSLIPQTWLFFWRPDGHLLKQPNMVDANCDLCGGTRKNQCGACTGTGQRDPDPSIGDYTGGNCYTCGGEGQINCVKCNKQSAGDVIKEKLGL